MKPPCCYVSVGEEATGLGYVFGASGHCSNSGLCVGQDNIQI